MPDEDLVRTGQVARAVNCSTSYVKRAADRGELPCDRPTGNWRWYRRADVERWAGLMGRPVRWKD